MPSRGYRIFISRCSSPAFALLLLACAHAVAAVHDLGRSGSVYEIAEPDAVEEIEERISAIDRKALRKEMEEKAFSYRPVNLATLPPVTADTVRLKDMTYALEFDIPDGKGGILYPRGFTFNPLKYVPFSQTLVVLNGSLERELRWFLSSEYSKERNLKVLLTDGDWKEASMRLGRHVFYLTTPVAGRLDIRATPSVVRAKGNRYMEVREFYVKPDGGAPSGR